MYVNVPGVKVDWDPIGVSAKWAFTHSILNIIMFILQHDTSARIMRKESGEKNLDVRKKLHRYTAQLRISKITKFLWTDDPFH